MNPVEELDSDRSENSSFLVGWVLTARDHRWSEVGQIQSVYLLMLFIMLVINMKYDDWEITLTVSTAIGVALLPADITNIQR